MPTYDAAGVQLHYEDRGTGAPVLLLHGMGSSVASGWEATGWADLLVSAGRRVIALDARGCGQSAPVADAAQLRGRPYIQDIAALLDRVGVERADLIGYSMGAGQTLGFALAAPARVRSIVLGGLGGIALAMAGLYAESALHSRERLVRSAALIGGAFAERNENVRRYATAYFEALACDALGPGALETLTLPALIVVGDGDTAQGDFAALPLSAMLARRLPAAQRLVLDGVNHLTCVPDRRFKQAVLDFYTNLGG